MDQAQLKQLTDFKQRTDQEREEIAAGLLSPLSKVYELDFGPDFEGPRILRFRRVKLEDRVSLANSAKDDKMLDVASELLAKYSADNIPKETWLHMTRKDVEYEKLHPEEETGEKSAEFRRIVMNLLALSEGGSEDGMMEFFRALQDRLNDRSTLPIPTPDAEGNPHDGT